MDRNLLLPLLAVGVCLHIALLGLVAVWRAVRDRLTRPGEPGVQGAPEYTAAVERVDGPASPALPASAQPTEAGGAVVPPDAPDAAAQDSSLLEIAEIPDAVDASDRPAPGAPEEPAATRPGKRVRRFTMPDLGADDDRAARSIAAFLGEPIPSAGGRRQRRRSRARRRSGAPERMHLVLVLAAEPPPGRVVRAVAAALRDTVREGDEVVELPGGRIRVMLDAAGSDAFLERARGVVRPWLEVIGPDLALRVEGREPVTHEVASAAG